MRNKARSKSETSISIIRDAKYNTDGPNPSAGQQTLFASAQSCAEGTSTCFFQVAHDVTVSSTFTSTQATTVTNTFGGSVTAQTGLQPNRDGLRHHSPLRRQHSTSKAITNSTAFAVIKIFQQQPGTNAYLNFTPLFNCWGATPDCGTPDKAYFEFCNPALTPDGKDVQDDYTVVYTN